MSPLMDLKDSPFLALYAHLMGKERQQRSFLRELKIGRATIQRNGFIFAKGPLTVHAMVATP
tara:strand:+ start:452 stop:637 length:186 start_codon:yes stop_codon:yes gene_type:complete